MRAAPPARCRSPAIAWPARPAPPTSPTPCYGGYSQTRYYASFVGFAPARTPRLLVAVMVDEPQGEIAGGVVAAPAFRDIASFALTYLRIAPDDPEGAGATAGAPAPSTVSAPAAPGPG